MRKKKVGVFICILFLVISVISGFNGANITSANFLNNPPDQLDQYQTLWNTNLGCDFGLFMAQSFKPAYPTLTRVELLLGRHGELYTKLKISIRSSLDDDDLTLVSIWPNTVPKCEPPGWIEFDFNDIQVNPGQKYYIIYQPGSDFDNNSNLVWYRSTDNPYKNGEGWHYNINRGWIVEDNKDYCFKTYGYGQGGNNPPSIPIIDGKTEGKVGVTYRYTFASRDPNGDKIANYIVDWGDGNESIIEGPFKSGRQVCALHNWTTKGGYIIKAKAIDIYGAEGDWATYYVSITKSKAINLNLFLQRFFYRFPFFVKILNQRL